MKSDLYLHSLLEQVPRILGLLNRNPVSRTYGSFDREFWHYNTVDFSCARKQEAVLTLALVYTTEHQDNPYYQKPALREWIKAGVDFWISIQEKGGSFNEWYPHEHSFVATSFSLYALSETLLLMREHIEDSLFQKGCACCSRAASWLGKKNELRVQNQQSGAIAGIYNTFLLTGNEHHKKSSEQKLSLLAKAQHEEGWFIEYGGADIGYLSLMIDYLAKYYSKSEDKNALAILEKSLSFIKWFLHPDGTAGGSYGSRNTSYLIPSGFELLSSMNEDAAHICSHIRSSLTAKKSVHPGNLDDRYLRYIGYTWAQAYLARGTAGPLAMESSYDKYFPGAGLLVIHTPDHHLVVNTKKGGVFTSISGTKRVVDSGLEIIDNGKGLSSAWVGDAVYERKENTLRISGSFSFISDRTMSPATTIQLRSFQSTLGRSEKVGLYVKEKLRDLLITKKKPSGHTFVREILLDKHIVRDTIHLAHPVTRLIVGAKSSYIYVPSSRYFEKGDEENSYTAHENVSGTLSVERDLLTGTIVRS